MRLRTPLICATVLACVATAAPAQAARWSAADPVGDAYRQIDVTRLSVDHGRRVVRATVRFRELKVSAVDTLVIAIVPRRRPTDSTWQATARRAHEGAPLRASLRVGMRATRPVRCPGFSLRWRRSSVRATVPQSCLRGASGPARFSVSVMSIDGSSDHAPGRPRWVPRG